MQNAALSIVKTARAYSYHSAFKGLSFIYHPFIPRYIVFVTAYASLNKQQTVRDIVSQAAFTCHPAVSPPLQPPCRGEEL
jgi:hypothetical protein